MRVDFYTKTILTLIALLLAVVVYKPSIQPTSAASGSVEPVVLCSSCGLPGADQGAMILMDRNNGDVWLYSDEALAGSRKPVKWGRLVLGEAVTRYK
jgi:hypothetical protein